MPKIPETKNLKASTTDMLNAVRSDLENQFNDPFPLADGTLETLAAIGEAVTTPGPVRNSFLPALMNRIALVTVQSRQYQNPWAMFKKGIMKYGDSIEEIFVNMAKVKQFDPDRAEREVFKREKPDVQVAFHRMNYQKYYKITISTQELRQAFLSEEGLYDLVNRIIEQMYTASNYDEFLVMKYMIGKMALNGSVATETIQQISETTAKGAITKIKAMLNNWQFFSRNYNAAHVRNYTDPRDAIMITRGDVDAIFDVEVLAAAFQLPYVDFIKNRVLVDSFEMTDEERLIEILTTGDSPYIPFTTEENERLKKLATFICDRSWFMIFDNVNEVEDIRNPEGLYTNYDYHCWKTFSASPYSNACAFFMGDDPVTEASITSVTIAPKTFTLRPSILAPDATTLTATVAGTGDFNRGVTWSIPETQGVTINSQGEIAATVGAEDGTVTVTATAIEDRTKTDTATITISKKN